MAQSTFMSIMNGTEGGSTSILPGYCCVPDLNRYLTECVSSQKSVCGPSARRTIRVLPCVCKRAEDKAAVAIG